MLKRKIGESYADLLLISKGRKHVQRSKIYL